MGLSLVVIASVHNYTILVHVQNRGRKVNKRARERNLIDNLRDHVYISFKLAELVYFCLLI